jgi:hypothetical protein
MRRFLRRGTAIDTLLSFGHNPVFEQASTYTGILLLEKSPKKTFRYFEFGDTPRRELEAKLSLISIGDTTMYSYKDVGDEPWVLTKKGVPAILRTLARLENRLADVCDEILVGVQSGIDSVHVLGSAGRANKGGGLRRLYSERAHGDVEIEADLVKPFLRGEDVHRYEQLAAEYYCVYPYKLEDGKTIILEEDELRERFPRGFKYLHDYRRELAAKRASQKTNTRYWYSCHRARDMAVFESGRIVTPYISLGCNMTLCQPGLYHNTKVYSIVPGRHRTEHALYWLGVLNSRLAWWFVSNTGYVLRGGYYAFTTDYLGPFPVPTVSPSRKADKARHDKMVELVERMLDLHKQLPKAKTPHEQESLTRTIAATDNRIDALVYELYGLTEEEVGIVEKGKK